MALSPIVSRAEAFKKRTHHQFVPGIGFIVHSGAPELPIEANGAKNCAPPAGTKEGSAHVLKPPGGAPPMRMIWVQAESAWAPSKPGKGNRLAWTADHLKRAGWEYLGKDSATAKAH